MAQFRYKERYRLGLTVITGAGGAQNIGTVPLATLTAGMSNGTQVYFRVLVILFDQVGSTAYASMLELTATCALTAGPTYTLGSVSTNTVSGGATHTAATLDVNAGNLRVRVTPGNDNLDAYAVVEAFGP